MTELPTSQVKLILPEAATAVRRSLLTLIPETENEYLIVLDNTAAERQTTCPRSAEFYLYWRREGHARNAALVFGGAVHEGLEALLKDPNASPEAIDAKISAFFVDNPAPPDEYRTVQNAQLVLRHYRERAGLPDYAWNILRDVQGPIVERAFELPLGVLEVGANIQIPEWDVPRWVSKVHVAWSGRIDAVPNVYTLNRIADHKTTSIAGDSFIQEFLLNNATMGYVWAGQQIWPELDIRGFCLNAIFAKKPAAGCSLVDKGPRGGKPALDFFRAYFEYTPSQIEEWKFNALTIVEDFVHNMVRGYFPMHTKYCFNKYGKCQYHDVCTIPDKAVRHNVLMSDNFKPVTWNPTTGR